MALYQIKGSPFKPTTLGEIGRGLKDYGQNKQQFEQVQQQNQLRAAQQKLLELKIRQAEQPPQQFQPPEGFDLSGFSVSPEGEIRQQYKPKPKPKQFDVQKLNDILYQITHTKDKDDKITEIDPSPNDLRALQIAADQSGYELRRAAKSFASVGKLGRVIPPTFTYKLVPKKQSPKKAVDVTQLTDEQLDRIIGSK